jgi:Na+/H+ antiporter NhaD/arsenite permease-like protein
MFATAPLDYGGFMAWWGYVLIFVSALFGVLYREHWKLWFTGGALGSTVALLGINGNSIGSIAWTLASPEALISTAFVAAMYFAYEYCALGGFMKSGLAEAMAHHPFFRRSFNRRRNWMSFWPSALLDNVLMGKIAKVLTLVRKRHKQIEPNDAAPIINSANAGGAWSLFGDTTSIMIAAQILVKTGMWWLLFAALPACIAYQLVINFFTPEDTKEEKEEEAAEHEPVKVEWSYLWPMLAVPGLMIGMMISMFAPEPGHVDAKQELAARVEREAVTEEQGKAVIQPGDKAPQIDAEAVKKDGVANDDHDDLPARYLKEAWPLIGLLSGFILGLMILTLSGGSAKVQWGLFTSMELWINTIFIVLLLSLAHFLPAKELVVALSGVDPIVLFFLIALLSGILDNIALTQALILLAVASGNPQAYPWALISYAVGVGGNLFWSGSSAGINVTMPAEEHGHAGEYNKSRDIRYWLGQGGWTYKVFLALTVGYLVHIIVFWWILGIRI